MNIGRAFKPIRRATDAVLIPTTMAVWLTAVPGVDRLAVNATRKLLPDAPQATLVLKQVLSSKQMAWTRAFSGFMGGAAGIAAASPALKNKRTRRLLTNQGFGKILENAKDNDDKNLKRLLLIKQIGNFDIKDNRTIRQIISDVATCSLEGLKTGTAYGIFNTAFLTYSPKSLYGLIMPIANAESYSFVTRIIEPNGLITKSKVNLFSLTKDFCCKRYKKVNDSIKGWRDIFRNLDK